MPLSEEDSAVVVIWTSNTNGITDSEGARGSEFKVRHTRRHVRTPIDVVDTVPKVVTTGQDRGARGTADSAAAM